LRATLQDRLRVVPTRLSIYKKDKVKLEKGGSVKKESVKKESIESAVEVLIYDYELAKPSV
jgi:hypothetical protein